MKKKLSKFYSFLLIFTHLLLSSEICILEHRYCNKSLWNSYESFQKMRSNEVKWGQVRSSEVKWGKMMLNININNIKSHQIRSNEVIWGQRSSEVKRGQVRSNVKYHLITWNEVNWSQMRSSEVTEAKWCQLRSSEVNEVNKGKINKNVTVFVTESVTLNVIVIVSWHDVYK